jgi:hypothetical protein
VLALRVADPLGRAVAGAEVALMADGFLLDLACTDADGLATLGLPLQADAPDPGSLRLAVAAAGFHGLRCAVPPRMTLALALHPLDPFAGGWGAETTGLSEAPDLVALGAQPVRIGLVTEGGGAPEDGAAEVLAGLTAGLDCETVTRRLPDRAGAAALACALSGLVADGAAIVVLGATPRRADARLARAVDAAWEAGAMVLCPAGHAAWLPSGALSVAPVARPDRLQGDDPLRQLCHPAGPDGLAALVGYECLEAADLIAPGLGLMPAGGGRLVSGAVAACAHVAAFLARLILASPELARAQRSRARADAVEAALWRSSRPVQMPGQAQPLRLPVWGAARPMRLDARAESRMADAAAGTLAALAAPLPGKR